MALTLLGNENVESELALRKRKSVWVGNIPKKKSGKLTGWISYTLSRTEKRIDGIK